MKFFQKSFDLLIFFVYFSGVIFLGIGMLINLFIVEDNTVSGYTKVCIPQDIVVYYEVCLLPTFGNEGY
mgnify:FL=1